MLITKETWKAWKSCERVMIFNLRLACICILVECYTIDSGQKRTKHRVNCKNYHKFFSTSILTTNKNLHYQAFDYCCQRSSNKNIKTNSKLVAKCVEAVQRHHLKNSMMNDNPLVPAPISNPKKRQTSKKLEKLKRFKGKVKYGHFGSILGSFGPIWTVP